MGGWKRVRFVRSAVPTTTLLNTVKVFVVCCAARVAQMEEGRKLGGKQLIIYKYIP